MAVPCRKRSYRRNSVCQLLAEGHRWTLSFECQLCGNFRVVEGKIHNLWD